MPGKFNLPQAGDKLYKLAKILVANKSVIYRRLVSHWDDPEDLVIAAREPDGGVGE